VPMYRSSLIRNPSLANPMAPAMAAGDQASTISTGLDHHRSFADATPAQNSAVAPNRKVRPLEVFTSIRFA
jgi:hypothetical protein